MTPSGLSDLTTILGLRLDPMTAAGWQLADAFRGPEKRIEAEDLRRADLSTSGAVRLLICEDNRADVFLVKEAIAQHNVPVSVEVIEDGEIAIKMIEHVDDHPETICPGLMLLDLNLPRRSGKEVLERMRQSEKCRHVPVIVFTSSDSPTDRADVAALGARRYFRKPPLYNEFMKLGALLNEVLAEEHSKED